ncbi:flagellar motor protein MotB [Sesbania bispinosa]|nr:flagellar motor protein MotB [Sesbania bispinosa]
MSENCKLVGLKSSRMSMKHLDGFKDSTQSHGLKSEWQVAQSELIRFFNSKIKLYVRMMSIRIQV